MLPSVICVSALAALSLVFAGVLLWARVPFEGWKPKGLQVDGCRMPLESAQDERSVLKSYTLEKPRPSNVS